MQIVTYHMYIANYACIGAFFVNKVPSAAIAQRPAREMAILADSPRNKLNNLEFYIISPDENVIWPFGARLSFFNHTYIGGNNFEKRF